MVGSLTYARSTQNDTFLTDSTAPLVPVTSAQALVVNESATLKFFERPSRDLTLSAGLKYDLRENRTPVNTYAFYDNNEEPTGKSPFQYLFPTIPDMGTDINVATNTPYSRRVGQLNLEADYRIRQGSHIDVAWNSTKTDRYCLGSWVECINAQDAVENTLRADLFGSVSEQVSGQLGLTAGRRKVEYDEDSFLARVPMADQFPTGAPPGTSAYGTLVAQGLTGYGPATGLAPAAPPGSALGYYFPLNNALSNTLYAYRNRISELLGMRRYDQADRYLTKLRAKLAWQASDQVEVQGGLDLGKANYKASAYGMTKADSGALNLDATYTASEDFSLTLFGTYEEQRSQISSNTYTANSAATSVNGATAISGGCFATVALRNASNKIDPCLNWTSDTHDRSTTVGLSFTRKNLVPGKFDLWGSVIYNQGYTDIDVAGGNYANNPYAGVAGAPTKDIAAVYIPASALPTIKVTTVDLRLPGSYRIGAGQAHRVAYGYQRMRSADWGYEGLQDGAQVQVLPTREQAPNYNVNSIGVSYVVSFR